MMIALWVGAGAVLLLPAWYFWARTDRVPCTLDLESSHEHLHAILELEGFLPEPGDRVQMETSPTDFRQVELGERLSHRSTAVVRRASPLKRAWTKLTGGLEIKELFEVGFEG
jgi:hypothetical protein